MIEIHHLNKAFDENVVLKDIHVEIDEGKIFGLVGINGAGKSTLLRIMAGVYQADEGSVLIDGDSVYDEVIPKQKIFFLPDDPYYFSKLSGEKIKEIYVQFYPFDEFVFTNFITMFGLDIKAPLFKFSKGMRRQFFIAIALAIKPKYLFLDEVFDGLDPKARLTVKKELINMKNELGTTIILSSHSLRELEDICDTFGLLDGHQMKLESNLTDASQEVYKFQLVFNKAFDKTIFTDLHILRYQQVKKVVTIIVKGDKEEVVKKLEALSPVVMDELDIDFESLFLLEVGKEKHHA